MAVGQARNSPLAEVITWDLTGTGIDTDADVHRTWREQRVAWQVRGVESTDATALCGCVWGEEETGNYQEGG